VDGQLRPNVPYETGTYDQYMAETDQEKEERNMEWGMIQKDHKFHHGVAPSVASGNSEHQKVLDFMAGN
jgi:hypothetical protein